MRVGAEHPKAYLFLFMEKEVEVWKDVKGYEGYYQISNWGRVKSLDRIILKSGFPHKVKERILKQCFDGNYLCVGLYKESKNYSIRIHNLVGLHFIDNPNNQPILNHIDDDKLNNYYKNLEYCNYRENVNHHHNKGNKKCGVFFDKKAEKWRGQITINRKQLHLGTFNTQLEAYAARVKYEKDNNIQNKYL